MAVEWTNEQLDAINASGRAIIVSAAAGSGKTAVLIEKLRRLLCDEKSGVSADRIAVVTFTNDAAAQMRQRLSKALSSELEKDPLNAHIISQLSLLPAARISTIHSFCFDLIRENSGLAGTDPGFLILSDDDEEIVVARARANVFERWFSRRRRDMRRLISFFSPGENNDSFFSEMISQLRKKLLAQPFPREYAKRVINAYSEPYAGINEPMTAYYARCAAERMGYAADMLLTVLEVIDESAKETPQSYKSEYEAARQIADRAAESPELLFEGEPMHIDFLSMKTVPAALVPRESGSKRADKAIQGALTEIRKKAIEILSEYCEVTIGSDTYPPKSRFSFEDIRCDRAVHADICSALFALIGDVLDEERRLKNERNALGFSDAEQIACELLCTVCEDGSLVKTPLAESLSEYYSLVMLDEFQDSSAVQELIFRMISKGGTAYSPGTDFFAVGDVKQSIYRFRSSDPSIFIYNLKNSVPYCGDGKSTPAHIILNKNFRSSEYVIRLVNTVFSDIMSLPFGGVSYGGEESLVKGADSSDDLGPCEIIYIGTPQKKEGSTRVNNDDHSRQEARLVAHRIKMLMKSCTLHDENGERAVRPSDICILLRGMKTAPFFAKALAELGIPAAGAAEKGYLESAEIVTLVNLLRVIDNPTLDIPMTAVLMSPMFMFSAEHISLVRTAQKGSVFSDILACAYDCPEASPLFPAGFKEKCRSFCTELADLRKYAASHSTEELIRFIYDSTDFMSVVSILKDSAKKKANLRLLPVFAAEYDNSSAGGLSGFVRRINAMEESKKDFSAASAAAHSQEAVAIKTIHSSKGLEYPFVFLCGTDKQFVDEESKRGIKRAVDKVVFFPEFGAAFEICRKDVKTGEYTSYESFPYRAAADALKKSQTDEEMMILYVALTRAKHKLFITQRSSGKALERKKAMELLAASDRTGKRLAAAAMGNSHADWLGAALTEERLAALEAEGTVKRVYPEDILPQQDTDEAKKEWQAAAFSEETAREYERLISTDYDFTLSQTAAKLTVTELAKGGAADDRQRGLFLAGNNAERAVKGISAAQRGTAVHTFMQYADMRLLFERRDTDLFGAIKEELGRLVKTGRLTPPEAECADERSISEFVKSSLFERMMASPEIIRERKFLVRISDLNLDDEELMVYNGTEGMLQGVADCIFAEGDGYVIADYKTDRGVSGDILRKRYDRQLYLYARAFSAILDRPVKKGYLYSFFLGREIEIEL